MRVRTRLHSPRLSANFLPVAPILNRRRFGPAVVEEAAPVQLAPAPAAFAIQRSQPLQQEAPREAPSEPGELLPSYTLAGARPTPSVRTNQLLL
jgi:hypothetical protein